MNLRPKRRCSREAVSGFQRFAPGTAAPASRGVGGPLAPGRRRPGGTTGPGSAPLTPLLQPLPEPGGPPHEPGRRLLLVVSAPARPHARPALPRQVWGLRTGGGGGVSGGYSATGSARHFLIRGFGAQSRQPPRPLGRRERACVLMYPARGGESRAGASLVSMTTGGWLGAGLKWELSSRS